MDYRNARGSGGYGFVSPSLALPDLFRFGALILLLTTFAVSPLHITRSIYDVICVLDITGSMNVRDVTLDGEPARRIAFEKRAVQRLLAALPCGSRLGLAIFVERRPFMLFEPVETCENFAPLDEEIGAIDWRMGWDSESHIADGLLAAMGTANKAGADLIFLTDGQETPPLSWTGAPSFSRARGTAGGVIAGVGGHAFSPIPRFDQNGREAGVFMPGDVPSETGGLFRGHEHLSAVDEPHLRGLAAESGLAYLHLEDENALLPALSRTVARRSRDRTLDVRFVPAALALLLMVVANFDWNKGKAGGDQAIPPRPPGLT